MEKTKSQWIICILLVAVFATAVQPRLYGQDYLSKERENEIKTSGKFYWGEGSDFIEEMAKLSASVELSNQIIKEAVGQSEQLDEILKTIEMNAHLERVPQQGKIKILAWIVKDSVLVTVAMQRPITQVNKMQFTSSEPIVQQEEKPVPQPEEEFVPQPEIVSKPEIIPIVTGNPVLQELLACKNQKEVLRVVRNNGLVRGFNPSGFSNSEKCIIAVFTADGALSALLDGGGNSRTDLLSGKTVQNPERYYNREQYSLWYMEQKEEPHGEAGNVQNNNSSSYHSLQSPPIENTNGMFNARILLPKNWDGKSVLVNSFIYIDREDKKLQNKYNVHPGQRSPKDGHIYFDENDCFNDACWREIWDDDERFYEYPLSSNVIIKADVYNTMRKMTVAQFADCYKQGFYSSIDDTSGEEYGMFAKVTYKNGMITEIIEAYIP